MFVRLKEGLWVNTNHIVAIDPLVPTRSKPADTTLLTLSTSHAFGQVNTAEKASSLLRRINGGAS